MKILCYIISLKRRFEKWFYPKLYTYMAEKSALYFGYDSTVNGWFSGIGIRTIIHSDVHINSGLQLYGSNVHIYTGTHIGQNCQIHANCHDHKNGIPYQGYVEGYVVIKENVWIGNNVIILQNVTIGENSIIGAGSVIYKDVPPNSIVSSNEQRVIGKRDVNA